jgi:hypothetical protein
MAGKGRVDGSRGGLFPSHGAYPGGENEATTRERALLTWPSREAPARQGGPPPASGLIAPGPPWERNVPWGPLLFGRACGEPPPYRRRSPTEHSAEGRRMRHRGSLGEGGGRQSRRAPLASPRHLGGAAVAPRGPSPPRPGPRRWGSGNGATNSGLIRIVSTYPQIINELRQQPICPEIRPPQGRLSGALPCSPGLESKTKISGTRV